MTKYLFTVCGTGQQSNTQDSKNTNFPYSVAQLVTGFTVVPIIYPATVPFNTSYQQGVTTLESNINGLAAGDTFATCGYSQGAMVTSQVLKDGTGSSKFLGGVCFGNPMRKEGDIAPNVPNPGGHGIMDAASRLTSTPTTWWELAPKDDLAASVNSDLTGDIFTDIFMAFCEQASPTEVFQIVRNIRGGFPWTPWKIWVQLGEFLPYLTPDSFTGGQIPHTSYDKWEPLGDGRTAVKVAADYINTL